MTSEKQVCGKCSSSELQTVYFKQDLDPVEKKSILPLIKNLEKVGQKLTNV